jgi:DUF4097 and DUF4098 domain-containing protein YvlB
MAEPVRLNVSTRTGEVRVVAAPDQKLAVEGGTVHEHRGTFEVRRSSGASPLVVRCPAGSDVTVGTISGRVALEGPLGEVRVATVSGKVHVADAASVDVRSKSGSVEVLRCGGECRVVVTSAKVHVGRARRAAIAGVSGVVLAEDVEGADVKTVSGKVRVTTSGAGHVSVHTVSGKVEVQVPRDVRPATRLRSISGRVQCDCPVGDDGEIAVASVSGTIRVACG